MIKMLHSMSGNGFSVVPGEETDVFDSADEQRLVAAGFAVSIDGAPKGKAPTPSTSATTPVPINELKTKADIVAAAKERHGLELDLKLSRDKLLAAVDEHLARSAQ